jgi:hypothetical protein
MFGIRLPLNFASSFKSTSIIEFWSRWHMTLTRFLTAYIYNPMVMSITRRRMSAGRRVWRPKRPEAVPFMVQLAIPTLITMGLAGIWHGAGWQFLAFGLCHGVLLVVNHGWRTLRHLLGARESYGMSARAVAVVATFVSVSASLVFFRADSLGHAWLILQAMAGFGGEFHGVPTMTGPDMSTMGPFEMLFRRFATLQGGLVLAGLAIVWTLPNTGQVVERLTADLERRRETGPRVIRWPLLRRDLPAAIPVRSGFLRGTGVGFLLALAMLRVMSHAPTEFLYFTF